MKQRKIMGTRGVWILCSLILGMGLSSCDLFMTPGVTIEERIDMFMKDVNTGNYGNLHTHFHPKDTLQRQQVAPAAFWTPVPFVSGTTYTYKIEAVVLDVATVRVTGGVLYTNTPFLFTMAKSGNDYFIKSLSIAGVVIVKTYIFN